MNDTKLKKALQEYIKILEENKEQVHAMAERANNERAMLRPVYAGQEMQIEATVKSLKEIIGEK